MPKKESIPPDFFFSCFALACFGSGFGYEGFSDFNSSSAKVLDDSGLLS
jgi:hypothetical protein